MEQPLDLSPHLLEVRAEVLEEVGRDALTFDQEAEQEMLGADVVVAHPAGFLEGDLDHLLDPAGGDDLLDDDPLVAAEHRLDGLAGLADLHAEIAKNLGGESLTFPQQAEEKMFRPDVAVMRPLGLFLGKRKHLLRSLCESLERIQSLLTPLTLGLPRGVGLAPPPVRSGEPLRRGPSRLTITLRVSGPIPDPRRLGKPSQVPLPI